MSYQPSSSSHPTQPTGPYPNSSSPPFPHSATTFASQPPVPPPPQRADDPQFDIFEWYPKYQSCQRYFLDHAQHSAPVQAVSAFLNIHLPFQRPAPTLSSTPRPNPSQPTIPLPTHVSLIPYLRRLVVTGLDFPGVLHGFFGDDWVPGVGPLHEQERRNYLFAAKSGGWASVKKDYDMLPLETVPFFRPLQGAVDAEIGAAEKSWSEWLAMEDWMVGPRAPESMGEGSGSGGRVKREEGGPS
ncbi:hypothetical protein MMC27_001302 [Xylographa pallens]|nr:hypothetical protein [Xylographa pallens]